jgi:Transposase DDE domain group 1
MYALFPLKWSNDNCPKGEKRNDSIFTSISPPKSIIDRGECENRIEEFKNGFRADRLICHRFLANPFRLLLHAAAYNLVNLFRLQLPQPWRSAQIETLRAHLFKIGARVRQTAR